MLLNSIYKKIADQCTTRYATLKPTGIVFGAIKSSQVSAALIVKSYSPARTFYVKKVPLCRSFNGINSCNIVNKKCKECKDNNYCTPQICIELEYRKMPYRMLLAYTSAQNFLLFVNRCKFKNIAVNDLPVLLYVKNRGHWGELLFEIKQQ